jgi:hypothetical protein
MDIQPFENYLAQISALVPLRMKDPTALQLIEECIDGQLAIHGDNPLYRDFFMAEKLFYQGTYEEALKHYVAAREIPLCRAFSFRTSSFVAHSREQDSLALTYAKKAYALYPQDEALREILIALDALPEHDEPLEMADEMLFAPEPEADISGDMAASQDSSSDIDDLFAPQESRYEELFSYAPECATMAMSLVGNSLELTDAADYSIPQPAMAMAAGQPSYEQHQQFHAPRSDMAQPPIELESNESHSHRALDELIKLATSDVSRDTVEDSLTNSCEGNAQLEQRIEQFQSAQRSRLEKYLQYSEQRQGLTEHALYVLNGWPFDAPTASQHAIELFTEGSRESCGGHYVRWNGKGIAINPGETFIDNFHEQGLSIRDIDFVLVTSGNSKCYGNVKALYELNNQLNKVASEVHVIHYYLQHRAYRDLLPILKPNSKLARHTLHNLEMFADSQEVEKIDISDDIVLHYFMATPQESFYPSAMQQELNNGCLGIRLELKAADEVGSSLQLGYLSTMKWTPLIAHYLGRCDLLLASFGNTCHGDYSKLSYNEDCLGYHGVYSLLEELSPRLLLLTEFGGREGDLRLEIVKKLRADSLQNLQRAQQPTTILPADVSCQVDLKSLQIKCSKSNSFVPLAHLHVVAADESFGRLCYLSSKLCL